MTTGAHTFEDLCSQIYWQLYSKLERKDDPNFRFATNGTAERVLHSGYLVSLFRCLPLGNRTVAQQFGLNEDELAERVDQRALHDFLAVLIFASCGIDAVRTFTTKLVASSELPLAGNSNGDGARRILPVQRHYLLDLFHQNTVIVDKFCSNQACFSTVVIENRREVFVDLTMQRLPYLEETELGSGAFGKVFKVKIAKGHFKDKVNGTSNETLNGAPIDVARKDYITTKEFGEKERETIETILNGSSRTCENILGNCGCICIGASAYSLFMPCAICDLSEYMTKHHTTRPNTITERADLVLSAKGLADGLEHLHSGMNDMVCYHMDLKPSNILVFLEEDYNGVTRYVWKLSDFGMARVKLKEHGQMVERNFNISFLHRSQPAPDKTPSGTINRRGEGTYLAPESTKRTATMTRASDVWALGCVLSVVFAYIEEGCEGVNKYQSKRLLHGDADGYDRFFLRSNILRSTRQHPEVHKWHNHLIKEASHRQEKDAVRHMLTYLEENVLLIDHEKRNTAKAVRKRLAETYNQFKKSTSIEAVPMANHSSQARQRANFFPKLAYSSITHRPTLQVASWQLSEVEGLKGCRFSHGGALVAYWSDTKIKLYDDLFVAPQLDAEKPKHIDSMAELSLPWRDCIWQSVALSENYLIASTTAAKFRCYIYDNDRARSYLVKLQLPRISNLAISSDSKTLACVVESKEEELDRASVLIIPVVDLIQGASSSQHNFTTLKLDWSAADITHISFPTPDEVYLVIQPQITAKSRENETTLIHLSLGTRPREVQTVVIQSQGLDPGNTVGLFTAFTAFRRRPATCAFITRQKQLHIQDLKKPDNNDSQKLIKNYRILEIVMDWNDRRIFALGTSSGHSRVYLLALSMPQSEEDEVSVEELLSLPDLSQSDELSLVFSSSKTNGYYENYILIAVLATASPRWIYRISLAQLSVTR